MRPHLQRNRMNKVKMIFRLLLGASSGVVEIALGLSMLFLYKCKAVVGALLALFFVLIFPGNLNQYFYHIDSFGLNTDTARLIRLFFQPVLIAWALWSTGGWKVCKEWMSRFRK